MITGAFNHYLADFARIADVLPGAGLPWLTRLRSRALDDFAQTGFPTRHDEEWKYTSVAAFEKHAFLAMPDNGSDAHAAAALVKHFTLDHDAVHLMVFHNGRFAPALSPPTNLPTGATLESVAHVFNSTPELLEPYLTGTVTGEDRQAAFGALNTAFMADGAYLHLRQGTVLEAPVHLLFISTAPGAASYLRNLIVAETGAQATVIEHYAGPDGKVYFTNAVTQIFAAENAAIEHHKLQQESDDAFHVAGIHAIQQRDSRLASHSFSLGAALTRNDITTLFAATGCEATLNGLYLAGGRQHVDNHTRIDHRHPGGTSRELYRGVLDGQSHAVFNGKVIVHPDAQKTNAYQANHNLLLSREAEIDTKPQLEIHADDVQCKHGATIGQIDETPLFYLRTRGLTEAVARNLLVHAFAYDLVERLRVASLRTRLEKILLAWLPQDESVKELS